MYYPSNIKNFFEAIEIKPLLQNSVIIHDKKEFRTDRWFGMSNGIKSHCYVFIDISNNGIQPFAKTPSQIKELIDSKKIIVKKYI